MDAQAKVLQPPDSDFRLLYCGQLHIGLGIHHQCDSTDSILLRVRAVCAPLARAEESCSYSCGSWRIFLLDIGDLVVAGAVINVQNAAFNWSQACSLLVASFVYWQYDKREMVVDGMELRKKCLACTHDWSRTSVPPAHRSSPNLSRRNFIPTSFLFPSNHSPSCYQLIFAR